MQKKIVQFNLVFIGYSLILGFIVGSVAAIFLGTVNGLIKLVWTDIPNQLNWSFYPLIVGLVGGVVVGLVQRFMGNYPKTMAETLTEFKTTGVVAYRHQISQNLIAALAVLTFGASLGPEAALSAILGGLITWLGDRLKLTMSSKNTLLELGIGAMLATVFHAPLAGVGQGLDAKSFTSSFKRKWVKTVLYLLTSVTGLLGFISVNRLFPKEQVFALHTPHIQWTAQVWLLLIPALMIGILFGNVFQLIERLTNRLASAIKRPQLLTIVAGLLLGISGMLSPYLLFSGEHQLFSFSQGAMQHSFSYLLLIGLSKTILTNICFAFGWRGGKIFPAIFASTAIGFSFALLLPYTPGLLVAIIVAASCTVIVGQPWVTATLLLFLFPVQFFPVIACGCLATAKLEKVDWHQVFQR